MVRKKGKGGSGRGEENINTTRRLRQLVGERVHAGSVGIRKLGRRRNRKGGKNQKLFCGRSAI